MKGRIYLDYAAAAPKTKEAARAERKAEAFFANPSSIHKDGLAAKNVLESARASVAKTLAAHSDEIVFTSTGTEADNLAILGAFEKAISSGAIAKPHIITLVTEHPAVIERYKHLEKAGAEVTYVPIGTNGLVDPKEVRAALRADTAMVSIMYANNEVGTIQPVREIAKEIRSFKKHSGDPSATYPLFHTDACQAAPYLNMNVEQLGVDLLSLSGVKLGAGHGAAVLYVCRGTPIAPTSFGGEQERGLRPGTENVPAVAALAVAFEAAQAKKEKESERLAKLRDFFIEQIKKEFPNARINGTMQDRLPNNIHISFPKIQSELLVLELDAKGISASAGSACSSAKESGSHVLEAMYGKGDEKEWGSVRFSMGAETKKRDIEKTLTVLKEILSKYKNWH